MNSDRSDTAIDPADVLARPKPAGETDEPPRHPDLSFTEDLALALLSRRDLSSQDIECLAQNAAVTKSRKVRLAIAAHPRAPRHVSLRLVRELDTFDLMQYALTPGVAADLKRAADELLAARVASITFGERIALARRGSERIAAALLLDRESRVWQTALENSHLTEATLVRALLRCTLSAALVEAVSHHAKWALRTEVRMALLRSEKTPLARALEFARSLPPAQVRAILHRSHLPEKVKLCVRKDLDARR